MATEQELLRTGVTALQTGDRENAIQALSQVVDMNPFNEQAWFYLAAADADPFMRKRYLQRVLELNPRNAKARDILDKLLAKEDALIVTTSSRPKPPTEPLVLETPPIIIPPADDPLAAVLNPPKAPPPQLRALSSSDSAPATFSWDTPSRDDDDDLPDLAAISPSRPSRAPSTAIPADDELLARLGIGSADDDAPPATESLPPTPRSTTYKTLRPLAADAGSLLGAAGEGGFALPIDIPGSPARVSGRSLLRGGISLLRSSTRILTRRQDAYTHEIERATWWRFVLYAGFVALLQTVPLVIVTALVDGRMATPQRAANPFGWVVVLLLAIPFYMLTLIVGSGISYGLQRQIEKVRVPFLKHLYAQSVVWLPLNLLATLAALICNLFNLLPVDSYSLFAVVITIALSVYAALTHNGATRHFMRDPMLDSKARRRQRLVSASTVIGIFGARLLFGLLLASITGVTLLVFLFS